jgi:hypothetical protein
MDVFSLSLGFIGASPLARKEARTMPPGHNRIRRAGDPADNRGVADLPGLSERQTCENIVTSSVADADFSTIACHVADARIGSERRKRIFRMARSLQKTNERRTL